MKSEFAKSTGHDDTYLEALTGDQAIQYFADWFGHDEAKAIDAMGFVGKEGMDIDDSTELNNR